MFGVSPQNWLVVLLAHPAFWIILIVVAIGVLYAFQHKKNRNVNTSLQAGMHGTPEETDDRT